MKSGVRLSNAPAQPETDTPVGINVGIGVVLVVVAAMIAATIPGVDRQARLGLVVAAVGLFAVITGDHLALGGVVVLGWLVADGFLENHLGQLSWHSSTDLTLLMLLVLVGAVGLAIGEAYRHVQRLRARWRVEVRWRALTTQCEEKEKHGA
jgi:hypothetical protein